MSTITIDSNITWSEDKDYTGDDIIVTNNAILTIDSWAKSGSVGDTLEDAEKGLITIKCKSLTVDEGAKISADGKGYPGPYAGINDQSDGRGPGKGLGSGDYSSGAGYGGKGGEGNWGVSGGSAYGSPADPIYMGSSGGASGTGSEAAEGGDGGGAIKIQAGNLTVDGVISANGGDYSDDLGGGGSGGSIFIMVDHMEGSGSLDANGGNGTSSDGGGGGGRVAVYYKIISSPTTNVDGGTGADNGESGTVRTTVCPCLPSHYFIENLSGNAPISFKFYKCINWNKQDHGGDVRWTEEIVMDDIFDDVSAEEREAGDTDYKKIFFASINFVPISGVKGYISQSTPAPNDEIYICATGTKDDTVTEASGYNFVHPLSLADPDAINWGTVQPGKYKPLWIKRVVQAAAGDGCTDNSFKIKIGKVS